MANSFLSDHPKGLYLLFFVEMWERFSFYGMRALFLLFMVKEMMFSVEKAGNIYGLYTGFVYLTPLLGGFLADRYLGQRRCVTIGAILMSLGLFMLSTDIKPLFFVALFTMIFANGFFKSNISSILGMLYEDNKEKKDSAYTIFYMGINLGAFMSPLVCGTLAVKYGFTWGFFSAGVGMLLGLIMYKLLENKYLKNAGLIPAGKKSEDNEVAEVDKEQKSRIFALFILMAFSVVFFTCFEQAGSSLTLFAEYSVDRGFFGHEIPPYYFQSLNPLYIILFAPLMSCLWTYLASKHKEPTSAEKFTFSLVLMGFAYSIMAIAGALSANMPVSVMWLVVVYFIMTIAELCLSPIGLSLVSKLAPKQFLSLLMGCWFLTSFLGNLLAGFWGGKYETMSHCIIFLTLAVLSFVSSCILGMFVPKLNKIIDKK